MKNVVVIGMGYVGFPLACAIARSKQYNIKGFEIDTQKVEKINNKISPIDDEIAEKDILENSFIASNDDSILKDANFILVCVPTPINDDFSPNLGPIRGACETISKNLSRGQNIIIESTINPGVCDEIVIPILEKSGLKAGVDFEVAHCPERINPGDLKWNVYNIPRNVGATTPKGTKLIADFYRTFINAEINEMKDIKHTEATKIIENTFRDVNIAYVNELSKSFDVLGLDIVDVINGAKNKPFSYLAHYPSCGVGGHCIPVDPYYLIERAKKAGFDHKFLNIARETNNSMPEYVIEKLVFALNGLGKSLKGTRVLLLGLSYKKDISDLRESPALNIKKLLEKYGAEITIYEPYNLELSDCKSLKKGLENQDVVLIATNHTVFQKEITNKLLEKNNIKILLDGKNCLDKYEYTDSSVKYIGVGR
ncbi:UDP-N-acetyl-D-glucosamine dehydrogenase [Candidatus Gracilibacteria bacterium]|nr:MAG: UDP-N-acetyl-D-glucosamine dehydrogenase [Candidatus Gracilibacteria bacterium]PIE85397.1 MAG: UDP-N-acetyl-D-glucosamine dehydrogenase [Candidatus Gracilibacteria bacterium]